MERFVRWLWSPFRRQHALPTVQHVTTRRTQQLSIPDPSTEARVANGRISKARSRSRSLKPWRRRRAPSAHESTSRHSNSPGPATTSKRNKCRNFVTKLQQTATRRNNIDAYKQRQADIIQHWKRLQQRIDAGGIRYERLCRQTTDEARRTAHSLRTVLDQYRKEQDDLDREQKHIDTLLRTSPQILARLEGDLFAEFQWAISHCKGVTGCIDFSPELLDRMCDARDVRDVVESYSDDPEDGTHESLLDDRALSARAEWYDDVMKRLYQFVRAALLDQGICQPDAGASQTNKPYVWPTDDNPTSRPPLTQKLIDDYKRARDVLESCLKTHDQHDEMEQNDWKKYLSKPERFPNPTEEHFHHLRRNSLRISAANLRKAEDQYVEARDAALRAGAEPLPVRLTMPREILRLNFPEFAGTHVDDGSVSSCDPGRKAEREPTTNAERPSVLKWMQAHAQYFDDLPNAATPELVVDRAGYQRLVQYCEQEKDPLAAQLRAQDPSADVVEYNQLLQYAGRSNEEGEPDIEPWESASQAERTPYLKGCIRRLKQHERSSGYMTIDVAEHS